MPVKNKWEGIINDCCVNKCFNKMENTKCIKGNGFVKLIDDENIKYINCVGKGKLMSARSLVLFKYF